MGYLNVPNKSTVSIYKAGGGPPPPEGDYILDDLGDARAAYSLNKLKADYVGSAVLVRRSSDNLTRAIGFYGGAFDVAAFESFIGAGQGYAQTFYDQSGNGLNATSITQGQQPQIVLQEGSYTLKCSTAGLACNPFLGETLSTCTMQVVWKAPVTKPSGFESFKSGIDFGSTNTFIAPWWTIQQCPIVFANNIKGEPDNSWEDGFWRQTIMKYSGGGLSLYEYGNIILSPFTQAGPAMDQLKIGNGPFGDGDTYFTEIIIWDTNVSPTSLWENFETRYPQYLQTSSDNLFVVAGDSISTTTYSGLGKSWSRVAMVDAGVEHWHGVVRGGITVVGLLAIQSRINWYAENMPGGEKVLVLFAGTNDMGFAGQTPAQLLTNVKSLFQNAKAAGFTKTILVSPLPRFQFNTPSNLTFETNRNTFTDNAIADTSGDIDYVVDVRTVPVGVNGAQDTTLYASDFVHPSASGSAAIGALVADTISLVNI